MRLTLMEMLQVFSQLENHVSAEKAWALELMRDVGFTVEPALGSPHGARHRVWIDADPQAPSRLPKGHDWESLCPARS